MPMDFGFWISFDWPMANGPGQRKSMRYPLGESSKKRIFYGQADTAQPPPPHHGRGGVGSSFLSLAGAERERRKGVEGGEGEEGEEGEDGEEGRGGNVVAYTRYTFISKHFVRPPTRPHPVGDG